MALWTLPAWTAKSILALFSLLLSQSNLCFMKALCTWMAR
jgi:hypothetical protein